MQRFGVVFERASFLRLSDSVNAPWAGAHATSRRGLNRGLWRAASIACEHEIEQAVNRPGRLSCECDAALVRGWCAGAYSQSASMQVQRIAERVPEDAGA